MRLTRTPMPTQRTIKVYKFDELSPKAKSRVMEKFRQYLLEDYDNDRLNESFAEQLDEVGLPSKKIYWSLSHSQGDGVAFYGHVDLDDYLEKNRLKSKYAGLYEDGLNFNLWFEIRQKGTGHYHHYNTMTVDLYPRGQDPTPKQEKLIDSLREHVQDQIQDLSRKFEGQGYDDIAYTASDENVIDFIEANEYDFDEDGRQL
jgi:hypothetical protein